MRVHTCRNGNDCDLCTETMQRDFEREIYRRADREDAAMAASSETTREPDSENTKTPVGEASR